MRFALTLVLLASLLVPLLASPPPAAAADCQFVLGFKALHDQVPGVVGECKESERYNPTNGDSLQLTTKGLLAWRRADNVAAFTDGYRSWVLGPYGLQTRLNVERFPWERDVHPLAVTKAGFGQSGTSVGLAVLVQNANAAFAIQGTRLDLTAFDAAGKAQAARSGIIAVVLPSQVRTIGVQVDVPAGVKIARIEAKASGGQYLPVVKQSPSFGVENVAYSAGSPGKVTGAVVSPFPTGFSNVYVGAVAYDAKGEIVGGGGLTVDSVPANGRKNVEVPVTTSSPPARVELYPSFTASSKPQ